MIVGIDEVGRGCWAGPVVAAAVALVKPLPGLKDSKKLTRSQRERLAVLIRSHAAAVGVGWVSPAELDAKGLTVAVSLAMQRALEAVETPYERIIIDGNFDFLPGNAKVETLVKADDLIPAVSAASIIAKVARDQYMASLDGEYRNYQFDKHVGYGTALHRALLQQHGVSDMHRLSFRPIQQLLHDAHL